MGRLPCVTVAGPALDLGLQLSGSADSQRGHRSQIHSCRLSSAATVPLLLLWATSCHLRGLSSGRRAQSCPQEGQLPCPGPYCLSALGRKGPQEESLAWVHVPWLPQGLLLWPT